MNGENLVAIIFHAVSTPSCTVSTARAAFSTISNIACAIFPIFAATCGADKTSNISAGAADTASTTVALTTAAASMMPSIAQLNSISSFLPSLSLSLSFTSPFLLSLEFFFSLLPVSLSSPHRVFFFSFSFFLFFDFDVVTTPLTPFLPCRALPPPDAQPRSSATTKLKNQQEKQKDDLLKNQQQKQKDDLLKIQQQKQRDDLLKNQQEKERAMEDEEEEEEEEEEEVNQTAAAAYNSSTGNDSSVPVTIITGFLGSGKTTIGK